MRKGISIIDGIIVLSIVIITITMLVFALGTSLDSLLYEFQSLSISMSPEFSDSMDSVLTLAEMFYIVPVLFLLLFTVWLFKLIIMKHRYVRYDEEEEEEW